MLLQIYLFVTENTIWFCMHMKSQLMYNWYGREYFLIWSFVNLLSFFLKEQMHTGHVADSCAVDSRLHVCYS